LALIKALKILWRCNSHGEDSFAALLAAFSLATLTALLAAFKMEGLAAFSLATLAALLAAFQMESLAAFSSATLVAFFAAFQWEGLAMAAKPADEGNSGSPGA